ncbi:phosphotransferase family protein [Gammaproteobacteria bacterium]|nr:phosphotransferase family protein [Gammaproteobacteria bacterium]
MQNLHNNLDIKNHNLEIIKTIKSGPVSEISICNFDNIKAILRIDYPCARKINIDRENEIFTLSQLKILDFCPEVLFSDLPYGILVWRYIEGIEFSLDEDSNKVFLKTLGNELKKIHDIDLPKSKKKYFNNDINFYRNLLNEVPENIILHRGFDLYDKLNNSDNYVFSHNDLNKTNLLWRDRLFFLDWEYSSFNNPFFDIASISNTYNLSKVDRAILWKAYTNNESSVLNDKNLREWMLFCHYLEYMWSISLIQNGKIHRKHLNLKKLEKKLKIII